MYIIIDILIEMYEIQQMMELQYALRFYKKKHFVLFVLIFLNFVKIVIGLYTPLLYSVVIDKIILKYTNEVYRLLIVLCIFQLLGIGIVYILKTTESKLTREINYSVKERIANSVLSVPFYKMSQYTKGRIQVLLTSDTVAPANFIMNILNAIFHIGVIIGVAITMYSISWEMTCIVMVMYPIILFINRIYNKKIHNTAVYLSEKNDLLVGIARKISGQLSDIKIQNGKEKILKQYCDIARVNKIANNKYLLYTIQNSSIISFLSYINYIFLMMSGAFLVLNGEMGLGDMIAFNTYSKTLSSSLDLVIQLKTNLQSSLVSISRLREMEIMYEEWNKEDCQKEKLQGEIKNISFKNVFFSYNSHEVLADFNMNFYSGIVGIKGKNGCGKTTLLKLIINELEIQKGEIHIGKLKIKDIEISSLKERISYVGADKFVYGLSIRDNLLLFSNNNKFEEKRIKEVLELLNVYDEFRALPNQLETIVEDECNLSSGQIQKLQLARAILKKPDIFLFDEAFSNLDIETKNKVLAYIKKECGEKIIILISHNQEDYGVCDYIIELCD